ncbi:MAG TPA: TetR/AcrR family transcriptional regulator [Polyangiales bacterium]
MPRPKQRTDALRERVLSVALKLLESEGVAQFTARRIAEAASTSLPAVYELFGDKAGLLRELFYSGFHALGEALECVAPSDDARADLTRALVVYRRFVRDNPVLAALMFSRPFADFEPGPSELAAGQRVREQLVGGVRRAIEASAIQGNATDIAHVLLALAQGLSAQESAGWLGTSKASVERRWTLAIGAVLDGLAPAPR